MKESLITILRDKTSTRAQFREAARNIAHILSGEVLELLEKEEYDVETPIEKSKGYKLKNHIILIPILRSGIALLENFLEFYSDADVGFVGMKRDEETAKPNLYYENLPKISPSDDVIILDPMIATGGSGSATLKILIDSGIKEEKIIFAAVIASEEGLATLKKNYPKIRIVVIQVDPELNANKFIVPGLGDFGDRYFGTE